jgi:ABC-type hemin transport system ATPase subunit
VERRPGRSGRGNDPRRLAYGPDESAALLAAPGAASILLLDSPVAGLAPGAAHALLAAARRRAESGVAVVLSTDLPHGVASHATTLALLVAGRLLSWGAPAIALVPALQILSAGGHPLGVGQAGSIMTSST